MSRRYVIIGGGAIGAHLAAQLTLAGIAAVLVARGEQLERLRAHPLTVNRHDRADSVRLVVAADAAEVGLRHGDVLVLATKTQDAEAAIIDWAWQPLTGGNGAGPGSLAADLPIIVLQNGVATEPLAERRFARVISVATIVPVTYLEPGQITALAHPRTGYLQLGALKGRDGQDEALVAEIATDLDRAGYLVRTRGDVTRRKHEKLLHNISNGVDVLTGTPQERAALTAVLVAETRSVLAAAGIDLSVQSNDEPNLEQWLGIGPPPPGAAPPRRSTWQSFARGRSSEIDFLNGEIVLLGRRLGVPTPANEGLQRLLGLSQALGEAPQTRQIADVLNLLQA